MDLILKEDVREMLSNAGVSVSSGMEYLNGLEYDLAGQTAYQRKDVERFLNR